MIPTWVAVVTGISLAILALAAIVIAAASVVAALGLRAFLRVLHELTGPAVGDVRALVATIRTEAEGLAWTSYSRWYRKRWRQRCSTWLRRCARCGAASRSSSGPSHAQTGEEALTGK